MLAGYDFVLDDHTQMPTEVMRRCTGLKHIIFLGTGARSYMHPEELAELGITVHIIKGYGDTAVAEHAIALMWAAARGIARMDRAIRARQLAAHRRPAADRQDASACSGSAASPRRWRASPAASGMRVLAWNRSPKTAHGVTFVDLDTLLAESHVLSVHLLLNDETRGLLSAGADRAHAAGGDPGEHRARRHRRRSGDDRGVAGRAACATPRWTCSPPSRCRPAIPLTRLENVTLSAHCAFRTPEASENLIRRALDIARDLAIG